MKKTEASEKISLTLEEAEALKDKVRGSHSSLSDQDIKLLVGLISFNLWLHQQLQLAKLTIHRLKAFFGMKTEKRKPEENEVSSGSEDDPAASDSGDNGSEQPPKPPPKRNPNKNHGRNGANNYAGCPTLSIEHTDYHKGDPCPSCLEGSAKGKLYQVTPGILIRLVGNPLITGKRYTIEKLRCNLCGEQYSASVPAEVAKAEKYAPSCKTTLAIGRYYMGLPFKRIETWQSFQGIPLADATQWDKVEGLYNIAKPVQQALTRLACESSSFHYDDTPNRILEQKKQYQLGQTSRKAVYTTAIISQVESYNIYQFITSEHYAGDNMEALLSERESSDPFLTMSDASPMNFPKKISETVLLRWIICFCLVHGRRKFFEVCKFFTEECDFVLRQISHVYKHEAYCKTNQLSPEERLAYHQTHSAPVMQTLWIWLNNQLLFDQVEPSCGLGQAIQYMLRHWHALTRFLHEVGAAIDNSWSERTLKIAIRHRINSLFYKTNHGAQVGDCMMSLIHTCVNNGGNAFDYLNSLQAYPEHVAAQPQLWFPWCYQTTRAQIMASSDKAA